MAVDADDDRKEKRVSQTSLDTILLYQLSLLDSVNTNTKIPYVHRDLSRTSQRDGSNPNWTAPKNTHSSSHLNQNRIMLDHDGPILHPELSRISPLCIPVSRVLFVHRTSNPYCQSVQTEQANRPNHTTSPPKTVQNTRCQAAPLSPCPLSSQVCQAAQPYELME